eukprot:698102-Alexandrium_andersonii.AAC.1
MLPFACTQRETSNTGPEELGPTSGPSGRGVRCRRRLRQSRARRLPKGALASEALGWETASTPR